MGGEANPYSPMLPTAALQHEETVGHSGPRPQAVVVLVMGEGGRSLLTGWDPEAQYCLSIPSEPILPGEDVYEAASKALCWTTRRLITYKSLVHHLGVWPVCTCRGVPADLVVLATVRSNIRSMLNPDFNQGGFLALAERTWELIHAELPGHLAGILQWHCMHSWRRYVTTRFCPSSRTRPDSEVAMGAYWTFISGSRSGHDPSSSFIVIISSQVSQRGPASFRSVGLSIKRCSIPHRAHNLKFAIPYFSGDPTHCSGRTLFSRKSIGA